MVLEGVGDGYRERNKLKNLRLSSRAPARRTSSLTKLEQANEKGTLSKRWATARASDLMKEEVTEGSPVKKNGGEPRWLGRDRKGDGGGRGRFLRGFLKGVARGGERDYIGHVFFGERLLLLGFCEGTDSAVREEASEIHVREYREERDDAVGSSDQREKKERKK